MAGPEARPEGQEPLQLQLEKQLVALEDYPRELCRGLLARLKDFEATVTHFHVAYEDSGSKNEREVLDRFGDYVEFLRRFLLRSIEKGGPALATWVLRMDEAAVTASGFLNSWFSHSHSDIPVTLVDSLRLALSELGMGDRALLVSVGLPNQLETGIPDANRALNYFDVGAEEPKFPPMSVFSIPAHEMSDPLRWLVTLGHEVAHQYLRNVDSDGLLRSELPPNFILKRLGLSAAAIEAQADGDVKADELLGCVNGWFEEVLCDIFLVHRYGPAGVAALGHYLAAVRATKFTATHPPAWFRIEMMLQYVDSDQAQLPLQLDPIVAPWRTYVATRNTQTPFPNDTFALAARCVQLHRDRIFAAVQSLDIVRYRPVNRLQSILLAHRQLSFGVPPYADRASSYPRGVAEPHDREKDTGANDLLEVTDADILNAGWLVDVALITAPDSPPIPVGQLVMKALQNLHLVSRSDVPLCDIRGVAQQLDIVDDDDSSSAACRGVLGRKALVRRLVSGQPSKRLTITPLIEGSLDQASFDLRLGTGFIVFQRTGTASFSSVRNEDPRRVQTYLEKPWGVPFVLHPGEVVLASALEYIALPLDLGAQVITRSSYGRLGLITATAVQVHPGYRGCLTLELVNLGTVPLELFPGERVAQLVVMAADVELTQHEAGDYFHGTYQCPTGPQFPNIKIDPWVERLTHR